MTPRAAAMVFGGALLLVLIAVVGWWQVRDPGGRQSAGETQQLGPGGGLPVDIYFPGVGAGLVVERREILPQSSTAERVRYLLQEVLAGPSTGDAVRPLPADAALGEVYLAPSGIVYVDFAVPDQSDPPPSGSLTEILSVYSLVNTVQLNLPEVTSVVLLWNGKQRESFAGHVDTTRPLVANTQLVAP